jgi:hypothetical protein
VLRNRGLTVVAVPADTGYTIRLETLAPGRRTADRGVEELTGRDIVAYLAHSRVTEQCTPAPRWSTR